MIQAVHRYVIDHDNRWSFIVAYISLAVVLAIVLNLFWLSVVVAAHGVFEWVKHRQWVHDKVTLFAHVLWELKLDLGLILFGLAMEVYMEYVLGLAGLGAAARMGAQTGGRFVVLQNVLRGTLLSVDDAAQVARMVAARRNRLADGDEAAEPTAEEAEAEEAALDAAEEAAEGGRLGPWTGTYSRGDKASLIFGALCLLLILMGPVLTPHDMASVLETIGAQMHPIPSD